MESSGKACRKRAKEGQGQILGRLQEAEQKTSKSIHLLSLSGFIVTSKIYVLYYSPNSNWLALGGNENSSPRVPPSEQVEVCLFRGLPRDAENNDCVIFNQKIINFLKGSMERLRINWKSGKGGGGENKKEKSVSSSPWELRGSQRTKCWQAGLSNCHQTTAGQPPVCHIICTCIYVHMVCMCVFYYKF